MGKLLLNKWSLHPERFDIKKMRKGWSGALFDKLVEDKSLESFLSGNSCFALLGSCIIDLFRNEKGNCSTLFNL